MSDALPAIIHQAWWGDPIDPTLQAWCDEWAAMHPDWTHVMWTETSALELLAATPPLDDLWHRAATIHNPERLPRTRANLLRIAALWHHGGIWLDVDTQPLRRLDPLRHVGAFLCWESPGVCSNSPWGAPPGHPHLARCITGLESSLERAKTDGKWDFSGPRYVTHHLGDDVTVLDRRLFSHYLYWELDQHNRPPGVAAYGSHHWASKRRRTGVPLPE